jgi:hypothetical protein
MKLEPLFLMVAALMKAVRRWIRFTPASARLVPHGAGFDPWTSQTEERVGGDIVLRLKRKPGEPKIGYWGLAGKL